MKFLVDNQLPAALARFIESRDCHAKHVLDVGLAEASDIQIFRHAESDGYILVSKDEDFLHLALRPAVTTGLVVTCGVLMPIRVSVPFYHYAALPPSRSPLSVRYWQGIQSLRSGPVPLLA